MATRSAGGGYDWCACRDCFEIVIGDGISVTFCDDCNKAGCDEGSECQNPHSYGGVDGGGHCGDTDCCGDLEPPLADTLGGAR